MHLSVDAWCILNICIFVLFVFRKTLAWLTYFCMLWFFQGRIFNSTNEFCLTGCVISSHLFWLYWQWQWIKFSRIMSPFSIRVINNILGSSQNNARKHTSNLPIISATLKGIIRMLSPWQMKSVFNSHENSRKTSDDSKLVFSVSNVRASSTPSAWTGCHSHNILGPRTQTLSFNSYEAIENAVPLPIGVSYVWRIVNRGYAIR